MDTKNYAKLSYNKQKDLAIKKVTELESSNSRRVHDKHEITMTDE